MYLSLFCSLLGYHKPVGAFFLSQIYLAIHFLQFLKRNYLFFDRFSFVVSLFCTPVLSERLRGGVELRDGSDFQSDLGGQQGAAGEPVRAQISQL